MIPDTDTDTDTATREDPEGRADRIREFPPVVYLPCTAHVTDPATAQVEMRTTRDGRVALLAYSALDRLHDCCGHDQPWLVMPTRALEGLRETQPFQLLLLDVVIPPEHRHGVGT